MLNILLKRLPPSAKYIAWVDADVTFLAPRWALDALKLLKTYDLIQLFEDSDFLGADGKPEATAKSLMYYATRNVSRIKEFNKKPETYPHPGYAWAATFDYLENTGGLFEYNIVGSGDKLMSYGALGMW